MQTTTVTVQYVNQPKPGKKMGSIKASDGKYYNVWPDKLPLFSEGSTYTINYTEDNGFRTFKGMGNGEVGQQVGNVARNIARTAAPNDGQASKAEEMFVMGFLNRCYGGGSVMPPKAQLVAEGRMLRAAWQEIWSNYREEGVTVTRPRPEPDQALDDEIPF